MNRRFLQVAIVVLGLIPVGAGLAGVLAGPGMVGGSTAMVSVDSHFSYLSGLLLGIGLAYWSLVPAIERRQSPFRLLTLLVFAGGVGRLVSLVRFGVPAPPMLGGLAMELVVTPLLCLWQARIARPALARPVRTRVADGPAARPRAPGGARAATPSHRPRPAP